MINSSTVQQNGKAKTNKSTFFRETTVSIEIKAEPSIIWSILTNASDYPRWNSTVISIEGKIKSGEKIKLKSVLDPKRVFKLTIKEFEPEKRLVWGDARGKRIYSITKKENGKVYFYMTEKIGGLLFPVYAKMIPPFDESFEKFADDLRRKAETMMNSK